MARGRPTLNITELGARCFRVHPVMPSPENFPNFDPAIQRPEQPRPYVGRGVFPNRGHGAQHLQLGLKGAATQERALLAEARSCIACCLRCRTPSESSEGRIGGLLHSPSTSTQAVPTSARRRRTTQCRPTWAVHGDIHRSTQRPRRCQHHQPVLSKHWTLNTSPSACGRRLICAMSRPASSLVLCARKVRARPSQRPDVALLNRLFPANVLASHACGVPL